MKYHIIFSLLCLCMSTFAQNGLTPVDETHQEIWGKNNYDGLYSDEARVQFLEFPSFSSPSALYVGVNGKGNKKHRNRLVVRNNGKTYKIDTDSLTIKKLICLFEHSVNTSKYDYEHFGCDGTRYFFFNYSDGATCWSPKEQSVCRRLVRVIHFILAGVIAKDKKEIDSRMAEVDSLVKIFMSYYPDDFSEKQK